MNHFSAEHHQKQLSNQNKPIQDEDQVIWCVKAELQSAVRTSVSGIGLGGEAILLGDFFLNLWSFYLETKENIFGDETAPQNIRGIFSWHPPKPDK